MVNVIEPKVEVIDYYPKIVDEKGNVNMSPDEVLYYEMGVTYKDVGFLEQALEIQEAEEIEREKITRGIVKNAGKGHASIATGAGLVVMLKGNCSKMVDSIFTGVRHGSSLMPSGRRIPISKEQIVIPPGIFNNSEEAKNLYIKTSEKNIQAYEELQQKGVPKEEAAKIVQYGHRGGGSMVMPLETIIQVARNIHEEGSLIPWEAKNILLQLEEFIHSHDMEKVYESRMHSPRTGCVNPNIFHRRTNEASELADINLNNVLYNPVLLSAHADDFPEIDFRINQYLDHREKAFSTNEGIERNWKKILRELELIVEDFNTSVRVKTAANSPWRVWGEVKRHRALPQTTENVYHAIDRAREAVQIYGEMPKEGMSPNFLIDIFTPVLSIPPAVREPSVFSLWLERFADSVKTYEKLVKIGVLESDAVLVIPRGLKMVIKKDYDLYNLTTGYMSLRLCSTAEAEMRRITLAEKELIINSDLPESIKMLLNPKCSYVGFCFEDKCCGTVNTFSPAYNPEFHARINKLREQEIIEALG